MNYLHRQKAKTDRLLSGVEVFFELLRVGVRIEAWVKVRQRGLVTFSDSVQVLSWNTI